MCCFIECGYHTLLIIWHVFYYFWLFNTQFWKAKFQNVNEKNVWVIYWYQNLKKVEVNRVVKRWSGQAPVILSALFILFAGHVIVFMLWFIGVHNTYL